MKKGLILILSAIFALQSFAVTDKEMEEAKTIAAQAYLRYANNGSGYLDDVNVSTMAELKSKLRKKELENLNDFNSVSIPSDYATWDKNRLVEFWGITFFSSPKLSEEGRKGKIRAKSRIEKMTIGAVEAPVETPVEEPKEEVKSEEVPVAEPSATPTAVEDSILTDQNAMLEDAEAASSPRQSNGTWIYVVILIVLLAAVAALLMFAAKTMKNNGQGEKDSSAAPLKDEPSTAPVATDKSKALLKQYSATVEQLNLDNDALRNEVSALKAELASAQKALAHANEELVKLQSMAQRPATPVATPTPFSTRPEPQPEERTTAANGMPNIIYLGRANKNGIFVRADRKMTPNASIYRLDTSDGLVGSFHVVDHPAVINFISANPLETLERGCTAEFAELPGAQHIITESAGTAIFESGCWKVLRKCRVRFE